MASVSPRSWCDRSMESRSKSKSKDENGKVYLVGAGPGDLGLVTLRAKECIEQADVIVYDHLANAEMLGWARADSELIFAGKKAGEHTLSQQEINALLVEKADGGKQVVRLKGGDPLVFGRGAEEAKAVVDAGIEFEIVPGVTSAIAGPAYAGIPVTHRAENSHVTFFTGHEDPAKPESAIDYAALAKLGGTQVMLMGVERLEAITREMLKQGVRADLPVALVRWATTGRQETLTGTLQDIAQSAIDRGFEAFFEIFFKLYDDAREIGAARIAAIGPATAQQVKDFHLHVDLQPEEFVAEAIVREFQKQGDVENLRILLVRAEKARDVLPKQLSALGAIVDEGFAYRTVPETRDITGARRQLLEEGADLITFTSSSTVENFVALGLTWPKGMQVASIGPITSKTARDHGLNIDIEARRHDIDGLVQAIRRCRGD